MRLFCFPLLLLLASGCTSERDEVIQKSRLAEADAIRKARPSHAIRAFNGTIYGKNLGEFGGEIGFTPANGHSYQLIQENSEGIFKLGDKFIALTGLSHLGRYYGHAFVINRSESGRIIANKVLDLPGTPYEAKLQGETIEFLAVIPELYSPENTGIPTMPCYYMDSELKLHKISCPKRLQRPRS